MGKLVLTEGCQALFGGGKEADLIKVYGCYLLSLVHWAELEGGVGYDVSGVLGLYRKALGGGLIQADCTVLDPAKVYNLAAGVKRYRDARILGERPDESGYFVMRNVKVGRDGRQLVHFTLWVPGVGVWDPLPPKRPTNVGYSIEGYRVLV